MSDIFSTNGTYVTYTKYSYESIESKSGFSKSDLKLLSMMGKSRVPSSPLLKFFHFIFFHSKTDHGYIIQ